MSTYTYHLDGGHGWLEVPYKDFLNAGLTLSQVKHYSYANVENFVPTLYLEHDCHMPLFLKAMKDRGVDVEFTWKHHDGDAFIRNFGRV